MENSMIRTFAILVCMSVANCHGATANTNRASVLQAKITRYTNVLVDVPKEYALRVEANTTNVVFTVTFQTLQAIFDSSKSGRLKELRLKLGDETPYRWTVYYDRAGKAMVGTNTLRSVTEAKQKESFMRRFFVKPLGLDERENARRNFRSKGFVIGDYEIDTATGESTNNSVGVIRRDWIDFFERLKGAAHER